MAKRTKKETRMVLVKVGRGEPLLKPVTSKSHRLVTRNRRPFGRAMNFSTAIPFVQDRFIDTTRVHKQARRTPWPYSFGKPLTERQKRQLQRLKAQKKRIAAGEIRRRLKH